VHWRASPAATTFLATYRAAYAAERSTFDGSLPENAPPPCGAGAAVGVDDDLAARDAGVAVRAADLEAPGRVHQVTHAVEHLLRQHRLDDLLDHRLGELGLLVVHARVVLRREHDRFDADRLAVAVAHGDLRLRVGRRNGRRPSRRTSLWRCTMRCA
jgi:hypothetical protein